ncbi:MAG: glycosyltransferase family 4 protein [Pseudomonadota bacterium]
MNVSRLHIGLVGPLPPPYGGMANQTRQLERLLQQEGISVDLVQVNGPYQPVWVGRIWGLRAIFRLVPYLIHLWQAASKVQLFHIMANSGWSWHLFAAPAIWIAWFKGKPVIVNYRGGEAEAFFQQSFFWIKPSLLRTRTIIVPSGFLKAVFAKNGFSATIVPNIIDLTKFSANIRHKTTHDPDFPHIIVTRNLESIYDNATAIRAFRVVKNIFHNARLTIAGSGPERQMLEDLVDELVLQDAVTFAGRIDNDAMADLYRTADLMVNASLVDNMPISILEALASSVPVVSTSAGGIPFLVEHGKTALLVPIQDPIAMSEAILQVLKNPVITQNLVKQGLESIQKYTWPFVKNHLLAIYVQVLKGESD